MKNETVQTQEATADAVAKATDKQRGDILATLAQCIPADLSFDDAQYGIIGNKTPFMNDIRGVFAKHSVEPIKKHLHGWKIFYETEFNLDCDFSQLKMPARKEDFDRLIIVPQGMTAQQVYDRCAVSFKCWKYTDDSLDEAVPTNERDSSNGAYAIWVRDVVEADEVHKNKSANNIKSAGLDTETLLERLLHELKYFKETGNHLDIENWTICSGSRYSDGDVPRVDWDSGRLKVGWDDPGNAYDYSRAREVCS